MDRVFEDVLERLVVLLCRLDLFRPEPAPEDVVLPAVAIVEGASVLTVEVAHPVREVGERRFDEEVVVVAEQAAGVQAPAVATADAPQDLGEDGPVAVVAEDRRVVIAFRADVVVGAGGEVAARSSHRGDRTAVIGPQRCVQRPGAGLAQTRQVPGSRRRRKRRVRTAEGRRAAAG
jgi:hypothetical protein